MDQLSGSFGSPRQNRNGKRFGRNDREENCPEKDSGQLTEAVP